MQFFVIELWKHFDKKSLLTLLKKLIVRLVTYRIQIYFYQWKKLFMCNFAIQEIRYVKRCLFNSLEYFWDLKFIITQILISYSLFVLRKRLKKIKLMDFLYSYVILVSLIKSFIKCFVYYVFYILNKISRQIISIFN